MSSPYPQPGDPGQQPWKPWMVEDSDRTWRSLGVIVHGPVILAKVPGITIGLRCIFAFPDRLTAWLAATADAAFIPQVLPPRSDAEAAVRGQQWEQWPGNANDPLVHAFVDHMPQRLALTERNDTWDGHDERRLSCAMRIFGLPTDDQLGFEVSWGPALAPVSTTLQLPDLQRLAASAPQYVGDDPAH